MFLNMCKHNKINTHFFFFFFKSLITIKEALHIKFKKPTINRQLFSQGSSFVLNVF